MTLDEVRAVAESPGIRRHGDFYLPPPRGRSPEPTRSTSRPRPRRRSSSLDTRDPGRSSNTSRRRPRSGPGSFDDEEVCWGILILPALFVALIQYGVFRWRKSHQDRLIHPLQHKGLSHSQFDFEGYASIIVFGLFIFTVYLFVHLMLVASLLQVLRRRLQSKNWQLFWQAVCSAACVLACVLPLFT